TALELLQKQKKYLLLDIGTGSGNIAISLARLSPNKKLKIFASDISAGALKVARTNACFHKVSRLIKFCRGNLFRAFNRFNLHEKVDLIVSNPPYISNRERKNLPLDVRKYEPPAALYVPTGSRGTFFHKQIITESTRYLKPGGYLVMEIGIGQAPELKEFLEKIGYFDMIIFLSDYNSIPRVVVTRCSGNSEL
ncbi:MAG: HemK/PrmC family methyltransferase, partial [Planctomycetota bacterium]